MKLFYRGCVSLLLCVAVCLGSTSCNKGTQDDSIAELLQKVNITPCYVSDDPLMEDEQRIALEETLYPNAMTILDWIYLGMLEIDADVTSAQYTTDVLHYSLVNSIPDKEALKSVCEVVFSEDYLTSYVYPLFFVGEAPLFVEDEGRLYFNTNTGGVTACMADFTGAQCITSQSDVWEIEVPMVSLDNPEGEMFTYRVIQQNGYWVLDSFYFLEK